MLWADKHFEIVDFTKNKLVLVSSKMWDSIFNYIYCDPTFTYTNTRIDVIISACQSLSINTHHWPDLFRALDFALYLYLCYLYNFIFESEFTRSLYILAISFGYIFAAYIKTVHSDRTFRPHIRTEHIRITQIHTNSSRKLFDSFRFYNYTVPPI